MDAQLYFGGPILTMDTPAQVPALLVREGVIQGVGSREALAAACPKARPVPLEGRALLPGFLDAHGHFLACAYAQLQCSVEGAGTVEEILARIQDGSFARDFMDDCANGHAWLLEQRRKINEHEIEKTGEKIRSMFSWIKKD